MIECPRPILPRKSFRFFAPRNEIRNNARVAIAPARFGKYFLETLVPSPFNQADRSPEIDARKTYTAEFVSLKYFRCKDTVKNCTLEFRRIIYFNETRLLVFWNL